MGRDYDELRILAVIFNFSGQPLILPVFPFLLRTVVNDLWLGIEQGMTAWGAGLGRIFEEFSTAFRAKFAAYGFQIAMDEGCYLFLTAHPEFVELAADYADVDQYWRVNNGKFSGLFTDSTLRPRVYIPLRSRVELTNPPE